MVRIRLLQGLQSRFQIGPVVEADLTKGIQRLQLVRKIEQPLHIELVHGSSVVQ